MHLPSPSWVEASDILLPHGNGCTPEQIRQKVAKLREMDVYARNPKPIVFNEDSARLDNMEAAAEEYCSWGYFAQGAGAGEEPYVSIWGPERETDFSKLSGFQTLPVNWGINTERKRRFFNRLEKLTSSTKESTATSA
ncbi:MAG: hypothetical protein ACLFWL_12990 [Candidatus Brocadiia bacterium]